MMTNDELNIFNFAKVALGLCVDNPRPCSRFTLRFFLKDKPCLFMRRCAPNIKVHKDDTDVVCFNRPISEELFYKLKDLISIYLVPSSDSWGYAYDYVIKGREKNLTILAADRFYNYTERSGQKNVEQTVSFDTSRLNVEKIDLIHSLFDTYWSSEHDYGEEYYAAIYNPLSRLTSQNRIKLLRKDPGQYEKELEKFYVKNTEALEKQKEISALAI